MGIYVVTARLFKNTDDKGDGVYARAYVRAIWEIVPAERFPSVGRLITSVLEENPEDHFTHGVSEPSVHFRYKMTTGEMLELDFRFPASLWLGIREIRLPDGTTMKSDDAAIFEDPFSFPLIEVREVDAGFLTGRTFAHSDGDGVITITNHFANFGLTLNSSDYRNPKRTGTILI